MFLLNKLCQTQLFSHMSAEEIKDCLQESKARFIDYRKDDTIFAQGEMPADLMMLIDGRIVIGNNSSDGKRAVIATFDQIGELFGEVFVFLHKKSYDHYAQAVTACKVLVIPRNFIYTEAAPNSTVHSKIVANILAILAHKAYFLNQRLQVMSRTTLRQKLAMALLQHADAAGHVNLAMNREALADFLNVARPSLSRELMKMQQDKLLLINKKEINIINTENLRNIL